MPVLFWIHGGSFQTGSGSQLDPSAFALQEGVIVVSVNYRLGLLGFMASELLQKSTGSTGGMNGIADQILALQWVFDSIEAFGGDPDRITVGGQEAGSISACFHTLIPSSHRINRVIMQGGSCLGPWAALSEGDGLLLTTRQLGNLSALSLEELQQLPLEAFSSLFAVPSVDGYLLAAGTRELIEDGELFFFGKEGGHVLIGSNTLDYNTPFPALVDVTRAALGSSVSMADLQSLFDQTTPGAGVGVAQKPALEDPFRRAYHAALNSSFGPDATRLLAAYPAEPNPWLSFRLSLAHACVVCPTLEITNEFHFAGANAFLYSYAWNPTESLTGLAPSSSEMPNIFGYESGFNNPELQEVMMASWGDFLRGDQPWLPFAPSPFGTNDTFMHLDGEGEAVPTRASYQAKCSLWEEIRADNEAALVEFCRPAIVPDSS